MERLKDLQASNLPILFFVLLSFGALDLFGQKYSNEFLSIGIGARARGMGNAAVASTNSVMAGYWNPAALGVLKLNGPQFGAMHTEQFAGVAKFDYLGVALPVANKDRLFGISLIRFGIDDIPNTLSLFEEDGTINYDNIVPFSSADYAFLGSFSQKLKSKKGDLYVGGNAKIVYRQIGPFANSFGFGLDASALFFGKKWRIGLVIRDATNTFNAWSFNLSDEERNVLSLTGNDLPINSVEKTKPQITLGIARPFTINDNWDLLVETDLIATTDGQRNTLVSADPISIDLAIGAELDFKDLVFIRLGFNNFQKESNFDTSSFLTVQPNLGIGLKIQQFKIDYAFTDVGEQRNQTYSHVISLIFN
ncbi:MAG: PorV/PorQ family protein, partial [Bacteroidota bacterium]